jgi:Spy/CpxP family protein refolding chaperone
VHDDDDDDDDRDDDDDVVGNFDFDMDDDDDDIADAVKDLGDLNLKPQQRDQIRKLRLDSDAKVAAAKRDLDRASEQLEKQLDNPAASDADISRAIDAVAQQEAAIRKARILAWHNARRVLDDAQRNKVQGAAKHKTK